MFKLFSIPVLDILLFQVLRDGEGSSSILRRKKDGSSWPSFSCCKSIAGCRCVDHSLCAHLLDQVGQGGGLLVP